MNVQRLGRLHKIPGRYDTALCRVVLFPRLIVAFPRGDLPFPPGHRPFPGRHHRLPFPFA